VLVFLDIDSLGPIIETEGLYDNLVYPPDEKNLPPKLVTNHFKATAFDDFVVGKGKPHLDTFTLFYTFSTGKGMIIHLDGPTGVGKTLTAESVAKAIKAPLYNMSADELETQRDGVEERLSDILELSTRWNAILLINEAIFFFGRAGSE